MVKKLKMNTFLGHITGFFKKVGHFIVNLFKVSKFALFNKVKYKTIDECINGYAFDFGYLYNLELAKMKEMVDYFTKYGISADNELYIKQMKLAIRLLEIIIEEGGYHFDWTNGGYVCDVKVNFKNAKRFVKDEEVMDYYTERYPHELYLLKAQYLYHKLRFYYEQYWWD